MEAGNRCFDQRVPEEINRKIVDHISDINMPYSSISANTCCAKDCRRPRHQDRQPDVEVLHHYLPKIQASDVLTRLGLTPEQYFLISAHREENIDDPRQFAKLVAVLNKVATTYGQRSRVHAPPHPQAHRGGRRFSPQPGQKLKPLGLCDYVRVIGPPTYHSGGVAGRPVPAARHARSLPDAERGKDQIQDVVGSGLAGERIESPQRAIKVEQNHLVRNGVGVRAFAASASAEIAVVMAWCWRRFVSMPGSASSSARG